MSLSERTIVKLALVGFGIVAVSYGATTRVGSSDPDTLFQVPHDNARIDYDNDRLAARPRHPLPLTKPQRWLSPGDYPTQAIRHEMEGSVLFTVRVDQYGEVDNCKITRTSGYPIFDQKVCAAIVTRAKFYPALDAEGLPVVGHYSSRVIWQLD